MKIGNICGLSSPQKGMFPFTKRCENTPQLAEGMNRLPSGIGLHF